MACVIQSYQPILHACPCSEEESVFLETAWLRTEVYDDFELNSTNCCRSPTLGSVYTICNRTKALPPRTVSLEAKAPAWWESELASSIHKTLKNKEVMKIEMKSPQLAFRAEIVEFLSAVCGHLAISTGTRHTAIRLMDYFMDGHNVMYYRLRLVSLTCLLIAAKFEERDDNIPTIDSIQYSLKLVDPTTTFSAEEMVTLEIYTLKYFKWNVSRPGVAHFIDYYHHISLNTCGTDWDKKILESQIQDFTDGFMEVALRDQQLLSYDPSQIAAAIVCVIRIYLRMDRVWTPELENASSYRLEDIQPLASQLLRL